MMHVLSPGPGTQEASISTSCSHCSDLLTTPPLGTFEISLGSAGFSVRENHSDHMISWPRVWFV